MELERGRGSSTTTKTKATAEIMAKKNEHFYFCCHKMGLSPFHHPFILSAVPGLRI